MSRLFLICSLLLVLIYNSINTDHSYHVNLKDEKSEFGTEDLNGRLEYDKLMLANPTTGYIPKNIRKLELSFAQQIDAQSIARSQNTDATSAGPFNVGGRTRAVALDIRDENIIIAGGVSGGIWKSVDGGTTWVKKSNPESLNSVTCLVQDTRVGMQDTWYYGTGERFANSASGGGAPYRGNGIYKSEDNGESWTSIASTVDSEPSVFNSQFQYIWDMELNHTNLTEDEIIVAAYGGILRSVDGGDSWSVEVGQQLFNLAPDVDVNELNVSFFTSIEKTSEGVFYAALSTVSAPDGNSPDAGIYVSPDGDNWSEFSELPFGIGYRRIVMGHAPSNPSTTYFIIDSNPTRLMRYDLIGFNSSNLPLGSWTDLSDNVPRFGGELGDYNTQGSFNMMIKVHPENEDLVFLGGRNLFRSTDGFQSEEATNWIGGYDPMGGSGSYLDHHPDQHDVIFYPSDEDKMLSASDGGLRLTDDINEDSVMWESRNNGYLTSQFYTVALSKEEGDDFILGGMQDNGTDISSGTQDWSGILGGDGGYAATTPGKELWFASFQDGQTYRLTLNEDFDITSFGRVDPQPLVNNEGSAYLFINPYILDPHNPNRMFIGGGNYLYVNENVSQIPGGSQEGTSVGWQQVDNTRIDFGGISSMDISADGGTLYFGSSNGFLHKVTDANNVLTRESSEITSPLFAENGFVSSISVNPENSEHLMVVFSNYEVVSVFESMNGGTTFESISGSLEQNADGTGNGPSVRWCELIPTNSGTLYMVGTSTGLYSTITVDGDATIWTKESPQLIGSSVIPMMDYRPTDGKLAIATHGNGVFTTTIDDYKKIETIREGEDFRLLSAFPNPFRTSTQIQYTIPSDGEVKIDLYAYNGHLIRNLLWAPQFAGLNSITWDGKNTSGTIVSNGTYLYTVTYEGSVKTGRLLLRN